MLLAWALVVELFEPRQATLPSIGRVAGTAAGLVADGTLAVNIAASMERLLLGALVGVLSGVVLGLIVGSNRTLTELTTPVVVFFSALSGIVWIPIAIVWLGIGRAMVIFILWNTVFFIVFSSTVLGVRMVPAALENSVRSFGGGRLHVMTRVTFPAALPSIISGVRVGVGFGWRSLIIAELIGASSGLGQMIFSATYFSRSDIVIAGVIVIGLLGFVLDQGVLAPLERRTIERWGMVATDE